MTSHIFIFVSILTVSAMAVAFLPLRKIHLRSLLASGAFLALIPVILKLAFLIFPHAEARLMPIDGYAPIQREYWLPFAVLFFALASHLVSVRHKRGILIITGMLALVAVQQTFWHLSEPESYKYEGKIVDGVCQQTSFETCGAASMVTLLNAIGIRTTEGEMARLSMTAPTRGLTPHLAAYGLKRKLSQLGHSENVAVMAPELYKLHKITKPFLAGIDFSSATNHMVCVLETNRDYLVVGDPISIGRKKWSWDHFEKQWLGLVIVCR
jgi:predicted double-glycine peptidase